MVYCNTSVLRKGFKQEKINSAMHIVKITILLKGCIASLIILRAYPSGSRFTLQVLATLRTVLTLGCGLFTSIAYATCHDNALMIDMKL